MSDRNALEQAVAHWRARVSANPADPVANCQLGLAHCRLGRPGEGVPFLQQAARLVPGNAEVLGALAEGLVSLQAPDRALAVYEQVLALAPNATPVLFRMAVLQNALGNLDAAIELYQRVVTLEPRNAAAQSNLGNALTRAGRAAEAVRSLGAAVALAPERAVYHYNLAKAQEVTLDLAGAERGYREALRLDPGLPEASWSLAMLRWLQGDMADAWRHYERRLFRRGFQRRPEIFERPAWQGEPFSGRTLLLYAEQGHGDSIQFVRYVAEVKVRGGTVVIECQPNLLRLFRHLDQADQVIARGDPLPPFDVQCSLMSLPAIFGTVRETIPGAVPYLHAPAAEVVTLPGDPGSFKVGLVWAGNPDNQPVDSRRSFRLADFAPLLDIPGITFYSLQTGAARAQLESFRSGGRIVDLAPDLGDFAHTAAVTGRLDLVVTADTAMAHLAGALGREAWIALSAFPDFRWFLEGDTSPWYPTVRLFRQKTQGDWAEVCARIAAELRSRLGDGASPSAR